MNNNEPIILGKIKRGKSGKPLVVLILFLIVGIFVLFLPNISDYFKKTILGEASDISQKPVQTTIKNIDEHILLNNKAIINFGNLSLSNFNLTTKSISFILNSDSNIEDTNYYLVLEKNDKDIQYIKLYNGNNNFEFLTELDNTLEINGYVKYIKDNEYPQVNLTSDESGLSILTCVKNNNKYEYTFNKNMLYSLKHNYTYSNDDINEYYKEYQKYMNKVNDINNNNGQASIEENIDNFIYNVEIDFDTYIGSLEKEYYSKNIKSNKVNFEMKAKGYDCK